MENIDIDNLIKKIKAYNPSSQEKRIRDAYDLSKKAHQGQLRDSGEEYIIHPLAVADILADLELDDTSIIAGILHDVVEDTDMSLDDIKDQFGDTMATLVEGVTKLSKLEYNNRQERQAENLRKMFLYMANDIRIILIKLADRLHNMRTLKFHHSQLRQKEIAEETQTIFAPLAHRLGIFWMKSELEDLSLSILEPEKFEDLKTRLDREFVENENYIGEICREIQESLKQMGIKAEVYGRTKNYYSIYHKMIKQHKDLKEIFDLYAVRVLVETVKDCYGALGVIHTKWKPIPGRFKDYIAMPKQNMYQSIHTTIFGDSGNPLEVQIRTRDMHRIAEYGIAAHWRYKEGKSGDDNFDKKVEWLRHMLEWQKEMQDDRQLVESIKTDLFDDKIFVFTPKGDVFELPAGSGPLDFAYRVHTQVGHTCVGAKVNCRLVPLDYKLKNGDIVEIVVSKGRGPNRDWLKLVKTEQAKNKIRQWFRKESRDENIQLGKSLLEKECKRYGHEPSEILKTDKLLEAAKNFNIHTVDDLFAALGYGALQVTSVLVRIKEDYRQEKDAGTKEKEADAVMHQVADYSQKLSKGIWVEGVPNVMVRLAQCCNPLPGDDISGYVTRGRGVSVHRSDCSNIKHYLATEPGRLIKVGWGEDVSGLYQVELEAVCMDRERLTMDIVSVMADTKTNLNGVHVYVDKKSKIATVALKFEVKTMDQLDYIIKRVSRVKDVMEVHRIKGPGNKRED